MSVSQQLTNRGIAGKPGARAQGETEDDKTTGQTEDDETTAETEDDKTTGQTEDDETTAETEDDETTGEGEDDSKETAAAPAKVVELCVAAGVPDMAAGLIDRKAGLKQVKGRIKAAAEIRKTVKLAAAANSVIDPKLADEFIAAGASVEHVKAMMFDLLNKHDGPLLRNALGSETVQASPAKQSQKLWDNAAKKTAARLQGHV